MSLEQAEEPKRRVAVVTGASRRRGISAAICLALARSGCDIFFTHWTPYDRTMEWGADDDGPAYLLGQVRGLGVSCEEMQADLSMPDKRRLRSGWALPRSR